jgi:hypothetical protein
VRKYLEERRRRAVLGTNGLRPDRARDLSGSVRPNDVYVATGRGIHRSQDRGATWSLISEAFGDRRFNSLLVDPFPSRTIYAGTEEATNAFVARFSSFGELTFSTYLGGLASGGLSVVVESGGSIVVAGHAGREFPLVRPFQTTFRGATATCSSRESSLRSSKALIAADMLARYS